MQVNNPQFQVKGTQIYNPQGQEFIIKGSNIFTWEGISNVDNYLNTWGFNTIRVPNYLLGSYNQPHPAANNYGTNHKIVDAYTSQGAVVIFDAHDRIGGYYENNQWEILKDYWRDMAREFKDNPYVWFNLQNEPGNATANPQKWVSYHRELIDLIRAEGANNLIVVDGEAWGQDYHTQTIANNASEIMANNENIVFSLHVYEQWNSQNLTTYFDTLHSQNIPVIVGEYGSENNGQSTLPASQQMLQAAQEREIGRIVWAAKSDDNNDLTTVSGGHAEYFNGTNNEILTQLGGLVWNDLQRTENLTQLAGYEANNSSHTYTDGVFEVDASGQIQFDFLFDGGGFQGELGVFNLAGMETYTPGSIEFIQAATARALSNSQQGYVVLRDTIEAGRFSGSLPWESQLNSGEYLGQKTFAMTAGTRFGLVLIQNGTIQEIANNPSRIWQNGKLPLFSMPEANFGTAAGQIVAVDSNGTFALEDVRVDWQESDRDYNDLVFQLQGANGLTPSMNQLVDPHRNWRTTEIGQNILEYAANNLQNDQNSGVFTVGATGQVQFDFLFDGGWFQGELAVFNLEGMKAYKPGSIAFIQEAARRAQTNSNLGYVLSKDSTDKALFSQSLPWEKDFNQGNYRGINSFTMKKGDKFALMLTQNNTTAAIAQNPNQIWQWGKLPIFSIPEANPGIDLTKQEAKSKRQCVAVNNNGVYAMEDVRIDWRESDYDYNDMVFKLTGAKGIAPAIDSAQNPERRWQNTATGQKLLKYANGTLYEGVFQVNQSGLVDVDFLYDSGAYQGEMGIFSLSGLANLDVTSVEFRKEAIRRALTNSNQGYVFLQDSLDKAKFTDPIESSWQKDLLTGEYKGIQSLAMNPGDLVGLVFNPKGTLNQLLNTTWSDNLRPMFSLAAANFNQVQVAAMTSSAHNTILGWEDIALNLGADSDYNDIVIGLEGVDSIGIPNLSANVNGNSNWLETVIGQNIINHF